MNSSASESALGSKIPPSGYRHYIPVGGLFVEAQVRHYCATGFTVAANHSMDTKHVQVGGDVCLVNGELS